MYGRRIEQVVLAVSAKAVLASGIERGFIAKAIAKGLPVSPAHFFGDHIEADAANTRRRPGEIAIDKILVEADGFKHLRAAIALDG